MGDSDVVELGDSIRGGLTTRVGYFVFGIYNIAAVIICLNMLIAMMSSSFENVLVSSTLYRIYVSVAILKV